MIIGLIIMRELDEALASMILGRALRCDSILIKYYIKCYMVIKEDYFIIIMTTVAKNYFSLEVTKELLSLLYEREEIRCFTNRYPIIFLNITYKLYVKALQFKLQSIFIEIIFIDQLTFLIMTFILDNIFLLHETME